MSDTAPDPAIASPAQNPHSVRLPTGETCEKQETAAPVTLNKSSGWRVEAWLSPTEGAKRVGLIADWGAKIHYSLLGLFGAQKISAATTNIAFSPDGRTSETVQLADEPQPNIAADSPHAQTLKALGITCHIGDMQRYPVIPTRELETLISPPPTPAASPAEPSKAIAEPLAK